MLRILSIVISITLGVFVVLGAAAWFIWRSDIPRTYLAETASERLGREVTIGSLGGDIGWDPSIALRDITVAGVDADGDRKFLTLEALELKLDGSELLKFQLAFHAIRIVGGELNLHRGKDGRTNWDFAETDAEVEGPDPLPEERAEFPVIHALVIAESRIRIVDDLNAARFDVQVDMAEGQADTGRQGLRLQGKGSVQDRPLVVKLTGDSVLTLQNEDVPYHLKASVEAGTTVLTADVTLTAPFKSRDLVADFSLKGPDLARLFPLTGISLPNTPPYDLQGRIALDGTLLRFTTLQGKVGDSDLAGDLEIELGRDRPAVTASLASKRLDFADLAAIIGADQEPVEGPDAPQDRQQGTNRSDASDKVIPDVPIDLSRMRAIDATLQYRARRVQADSLPIDNLSVVLSLQQGVLELKPLKLGIGSGTLQANVSVDASKDTVATKTSMKVIRLPLAKVLKTFAGDLGDAEDAIGAVGGTVSLQATGNTMHRTLASANGQLRLAMSEGRIGALLVEVAGLDIAESLAVVAAGDGATETTPIRCVIMDFDVVEGVMTANSLALDTKDTLIIGKGDINLGTETLALSLEPYPRDTSAAAMRSTLLIEGSFRNPSVMPDKAEIAARAGLAAALGALLTPLAAILPFIDPGNDQPSPCRHLAEESAAGKQ